MKQKSKEEPMEKQDNQKQCTVSPNGKHEPCYCVADKHCSFCNLSYKTIEFQEQAEPTPKVRQSIQQSPITSMPRPTGGWEKEFDNIFTYGGITGVIALKTDNAMDIKDFIHSLLATQREEIAEILEKHCIERKCLCAGEMLEQIEELKEDNG